MKYIDAEKLREKIYAEDTVSLAHGSLPEFDQGCHHAFLTILSIIDSLQQEQPEVDFDTEIHKKAMQLHTAPTYEELDRFARHFINIGLKLRKED